MFGDGRFGMNMEDISVHRLNIGNDSLWRVSAVYLYSVLWKINNSKIV